MAHQHHSQAGSILLLLLVLALSNCQLAPQFSVTNPVLSAVTSYKLSYYSSNNLTTSTSFNVNFNQSYMKIPDGVNNCTIKIGSVVAPSPSCNCTSRACTFRPMMVSDPRTVQIEIQNVTNPMFIYQQTLHVMVYFTASISYNYVVIIPSSNYQTMTMNINSIRQSDYGVGYTPVSYSFNVSLLYISKNMQMQITIPPEITFTSISSDLSFYSTIQNIIPLQVQSLLIYPLQIDTILNPVGFMLLNLTGLGNPRFLGNSTSFKITFVETNAVSNCANCKIAEISTGLMIESRVPGDVIAVSIYSSNKFISAINTLSINLQLYAGIPQGGKVSIYLPPQIRPTDPIECGNIYGYILPDNAAPICSYNSSSNRIDTVNFATPYFDSTGNGIISLKVTNPIDSRKVNFNFETYDNSGRMIGQSRSSSFFTATPVSMNVVINKTVQQVDKLYNMSCEINLTQSLNLSNNYIEVVLPSATYDLPSITCIAAGQNLNCTKSYDIMQQLVISFAPPCVQCSSSSVLRFLVTNLKNPSYINDANQQIVVNTRSAQGIIENGIKTLLLTPSTINLSSYSKPTNQVVGTQYNLTITLSLPDYIKVNGGQISMLFSPLSTYSDGLLSGFSYSGPSYSLEIVAGSNSSNILNNSVQYYSQYSPDTISKIVFSICDGVTSVCSLSISTYTFVIRRLKIGYIPALQTTDTIRISTKYGQVISQKIMDTSPYSPILQSTSLNIAVSRSITNSYSDFQFRFVNNQVVFDKTLTFTMPSSLIINGQCSISSSQGFINSFVCTKTAPNVITITSDFDINLMISQTITFTVSITNVTTPVSMAPLNYVLETTYNGTKNQRFSVRYAMLAPLPLSLTSTKSNNTINQQFILSLATSPATNQYDSYQLILAKNTIITQQEWLTSYGYSLTQNDTHYTLTKMGTLPNNIAEFRGKNTLSTYENPQLTINLLQAGFLVQQAAVVLNNNEPVMLGCTVTMSNRTVGVLANMTITCDRNSNGELLDKTLMVLLPTNSFDYSSATSNGNSISPSSPIANLPITSTSPRIVSVTITNVKNLLYIPNPSVSSYSSNSINSLQLVTIQDNSTKIVGRTLINPINFIPNDGYDIRGSTAVRNNLKSGQTTNISITYRTIFGTPQHVMRIVLPAGQNGFIAASGCITGPADDACNIIDSSATEMKLTLKPNTTVTLTKVSNIYPNPNKLLIHILTYPQLQLVQQSYVSVTPDISLQPISIVGRASSSKISDINTISLELRPTQLKIQSSNIIKISVPSRMFTRTFNTDDCSVKNLAASSSFTGCSYQFDSNGWLSMVRLSAFGPLDVDIGGVLFVNFTVTNSWTSYNFSTSAFVVTVYKNQTSGTSQGACNLSSIYQNLTSFTLIPISQSTSSFSQSSLVAGSQNSLTLNISISGNIGQSTKIMCLIPKDAYTFSSVSNPSLTLEREDPSYYYLSISTVCSTIGCQSYSQQISIQVQNNLFVKKQKNNPIFYAMYDGLAVTQSYSISTDYQVPLSVPSLGLTRSSAIGGDLTTVSLAFSLLPTANSPSMAFGEVTVDICNNITNPRVSSTSYSYSQVGQNGQVAGSSVSKNNQNITTIIPTAASGSTSGHQISITGKNTLEVPIGSQSYWVVIQNSTHILYTNYNVAFATKLQPLSLGLSLVRTNTTVGVVTQLKLQGSLPADDIINMAQYPLTVNNQVYSTIPQTSIDYLFTNYTNPAITSNEQPLPISLCNISHCIYKQSNTIITPSLIPINYSTNDVQITMPTVMNISTNYLMVINFTRPMNNRTFVKLTTDDRVYSAIVGVAGLSYNDLLQRTQSNTDLMFLMDSFLDGNGKTRKTLTIKSKTNRLINVSSLEITFKAPDYQLSLQDIELKLFLEAPSAVYSRNVNLTIVGNIMNSTLTCTSNRTNELSNYTLTIEPILRTGVISVEIPSYISNLYDNGTPNTFSDDTMYIHVQVEVNGVGVAVTGTNQDSINSINGLYRLTYLPATKIFMVNILFDQVILNSRNIVTLTLKNITNPPDNQVLNFTITQHEPEVVPTRIYGRRELSYRMTKLNPITVYSGVRNVTKIGANISLTLDISTTSSQPDLMTIKLSTTQVLVKEGDGYLCSVCIDGIDCASNQLIATSIQAENTLKITNHRPGRHNYTISGCIVNSLFSELPRNGDQIYVSLSSPYQTAETTFETSTYITPLVSTGQIQLLGISSSSNKRADYTTLTIRIKPQNYQNCDGVLIKFDQLAYYIHRNVKCFINSAEAQHYVINSSSLFIQVKQKTETFKIQIKNIINYIQNNGFVISSMKKKVASTSAAQSSESTSLRASFQYNPAEYGVADQIIVNSAANGFISYNADTRIVFPDNYVSSGEKKIIAINDYSLPVQLPLSGLRYSFNSPQLGCSHDLSYNKTISMSCSVSSSGLVSFTVKLFDARLSASALTSFTKSIFIYPQPKDHCSNVMCDVCSDGLTANQYCFSCREGLFSSNGQCVNDCPTSTFPYNEKTCTQCSPQCSQCYDIYDNSCLACKNTALVLDSGICRNYCENGFAYQAKFCVNSQQCTASTGCRLCSSTGFCYECLPDFKGEPNCKFSEILPKKFFIYWMIPFLLLLPIVTIITCLKVGKSTFSHMFIYLLSVIELMSWIFIIPKMPQQSLAMIMCAFLLLKILISIISYQTYYNKQITLGKQQKLLADNQRESEEKTDNIQGNSKNSKQMVKNQDSSSQQAITHKQRLARFSAHFLSCDAYELLMNKLGKPVMDIKHFMPYFVLTLLNRVIIISFLAYILSQYSSPSGDLLFLPLISILSGLSIILTRALMSEKAAACLSKIKG